MSTKPKTCPQKNSKKTRCKYASPICNDRAEAFVGPKPDILPKFSEVPSERDKRAFELSAKGMSQRQIAKELKTSQPTVQRAIKKYRLWFGSTLPEDRGELVGWARFRVAVEEQRIFLRHQQELAMEEWHQSRQPVPMKRKRTRLDPKGQKLDGMPIKEIQIDEYVQRRHASAAHLNAAAKRSLELTMLEAGYLGVRRLTCDQVIDTDERDRWDREVKGHEATIAGLTETIAGLTQRLAELEAKLAAVKGTPEQLPPLPLGALGEGRGEGLLPKSTPANPHPNRLPEGEGTQSEMRPLDESKNAQTTPAVNQKSTDSQVAKPTQQATSGERPDSSHPAFAKPESDESTAPRASLNPKPTSPYITVLGPGGRLIWLKKSEN